MALSADPAYEVNFFFTDKDNNQRAFTIYYSSAASFVSVFTDVSANVVPASAGISDAVLTGVRIGQGIHDPVAPVAPPTSDVERKGVFQFLPAGGGFMNIQVPSIRNTLIVPGSNIINTADPLVQAFITAMTTVGGGTNQPTSYRGETLVLSKSAPHKIHKGSSKG